MELVQGMRNAKELNYLRKALHTWNTQVLYISEDISDKAMFYIEQHFFSHSLQLAEALIGATAVAYSLPIFTGNDRHYKIIKDIQIKEISFMKMYVTKSLSTASKALERTGASHGAAEKEILENHRVL